ncbi:murein hydrolase activator EnvC family protein [Nonlabens sp. SY33080]|uniref:murein hydrolase activator EnvC family protein n=1 Tax=Nonlabens sp. SY33080 TaxID=2719911 RepID=UPI001428CF77|nr:peptidoglycan DD-metalloendopeptidase family protein [Nonlabens sp. SY33080]
MIKKLVVVLLVVFCGVHGTAQTQKELERKKAAIQDKINQYDRLLKEVRQEENTMTLLLETLDKKIASTQEIITITNREANALTRAIKNNRTEIKKLDEEVESLKKEYASMIVKAYKSKNDQSRLMFLLSSEDFLQAYKRVQYLKSIADYRKKQANEISEKSAQLKQKTEKLEIDKKQKEIVVAQNRKQKKELSKDKTEQENMLAVVNANKKKYSSQFKEAAKERDRLDREIKKLIAARIKESYKGSGKKVDKNKFFLTPEAKALAADFKSNRGKLPWPVNEGFVSRKYGEMPSPIDRNVRIYSNGWRFQTPKGESARAVFSGEVDAIVKKPNGILIVYIRHGNYTSVYNNLKSVAVSKGDKVKVYDTIGEVFTNRAGVSELRFILMEDTNTLNPAYWLLKG